MSPFRPASLGAARALVLAIPVGLALSGVALAQDSGMPVDSGDSGTVGEPLDTGAPTDTGMDTGMGDTGPIFTGPTFTAADLAGENGGSAIAEGCSSVGPAPLGLIPWVGPLVLLLGLSRRRR